MKTKNYSTTAITAITLALAPFTFAQAEGSERSIASDMDNSLSMSSSISVAYDSSTAVGNLRSATFATRESVLALVRSGVDANAQAVSKLQASAHNSDKIESKVEDVLDAQAEVRTKISDVSFADEDDFDDARDELIDALSAYAEATAELDAANR